MTRTIVNVIGNNPSQEWLNSCSVKDYVAWATTKFPRQMRQKSIDLGYAFNALYLMKRGQFKVPLDRVFDIAKTLEADPVFFRNKVVKEYMPVYFEEEQKYIDTSRKFPFEQEILALVREKNIKFAKLTEQDKNDINAILEKIKQRRVEELKRQEQTSI